MYLVDEVRTEEGTEFRCDIDGKVLWVKYKNGVEEVVGSCPHFFWKSIGNGCYPFKLDKDACAGIDWIPRNSIKRIQDGETYYFLLPRLRHYD